MKIVVTDGSTSTPPCLVLSVSVNDSVPSVVKSLSMITGTHSFLGEGGSAGWEAGIVTSTGGVHWKKSAPPKNNKTIITSQCTCGNSTAC